MTKVKMSEGFKLALAAIKTQENVSKLKEIDLFKEDKMADYFDVLWVFSTHKHKELLQIPFNQFIPAEQIGMGENHLIRVIYISDRFIACQTVLK